jgi:hypothetical protein
MKRLNQVVDTEQVCRFEVIFPVLANFETLKNLYRQELERPLNPIPRDTVYKDLNTCLKKIIRVGVLEELLMKSPCDSCHMRKG